MNYWLVKFAPFRCSWQDILRYGKFEIYAVRNAQARNNLKAMRLDDAVLFYHSQIGNCVMGIMRVEVEAHQDKTTSDQKWVSVTFVPKESFIKPVSLQIIKETPCLKSIGLVKQPRLSVMGLQKLEFSTICQLGS